MGWFSRKSSTKERAPLTRSEPPSVQVVQAIRQQSQAAAGSWSSTLDSITQHVNHMLGSRQSECIVELGSYRLHGGSGIVWVDPMHWTRLFQLYEALRDYYVPLGYRVEVRVTTKYASGGRGGRVLDLPDPPTAESIKWLCERSSVNMRVIVSAP